MSNFLKNLLIKDPEVVQPQKIIPEVKPTPVQPITPAISAPPEQQWVDILLKAIDKQKNANYDFLKFKDSVESLKEIIVGDEALRYKSAYTTAKAMSMDKIQLEDSAKYYFNILTKEQEAFNKNITTLQTDTITKKETEIKTLESELEKKQQEFLKLQQEIEDRKKQISEEKNTNNQEAQKIALTQAQFNSSFKLVWDDFSNCLDKVKLYL
jgi:hypothetical protein